VSFDGLSERFHVPDSTNVWRQNVPRRGPSAWEGTNLDRSWGEQNWRRMLIWVRNENRLWLEFVQC